MNMIMETIAKDCAELRDIAEWFDKSGKPSNGDFLRKVSNKLEVLFCAYNTKQNAINNYVSAIVEYQDARNPAIPIPFTDEIADRADAEWENLRSHRAGDGACITCMANCTHSVGDGPHTVAV